MKRLWVGGGRDFDDEDMMTTRLAPYIEEGWKWELVTGAGRGADLMAERMWRKAQLPYIGVPAQWNKHGRSAGPKRNQVIGYRWIPDVALFLPGGRGTENAKSVAAALGVTEDE